MLRKETPHIAKCARYELWKQTLESLGRLQMNDTYLICLYNFLYTLLIRISSV